MRDVFLGVVCVFMFFIVILGGDWLIEGNNFLLYRFFGPKQEQVRREIFENSKAYNQGMIQNLSNHYIDFQKGDDNVKSAIASIVLHDYADYDDNSLPQYLKDFMYKIRINQNPATPTEKAY